MNSSVVDTDAECTLIHGNPGCFVGPRAVMDGYVDKTNGAKQVLLHLGI